MASLNKVTLIGNLGRDPETRYTPDGGAITNFSIATTSSWKDKATGEKKEETEWHRLVFYNRLAEVAGEYLKKGSSIYIEGRLKTRKWQDKETGQEKYSTDIVVDSMQMLSGRNTGNTDSDDGHAGQTGQQTSPQQPKQVRAPAPSSFDDMSDDDIPF